VSSRRRKKEESFIIADTALRQGETTIFIKEQY
jgi:hypothetical protein